MESALLIAVSAYIIIIPLWGIFHRLSAQDGSLKESVLAVEMTGENPPGVGTGPEVAPRLSFCNRPEKKMKRLNR